ncbi:MAG: oxidoreductase, partial [Bacteroidota bacterium]
HGIYSIDFYDEDLGFAIGGDFSKPQVNAYNKMRTQDGGQHWELVANDAPPGYKSCVQFVPNSAGKGLVAVGFTGIDYSNDGGNTWVNLSEESFYTLRFLNDSIAYASGRNRIARLEFR